MEAAEDAEVRARGRKEPEPTADAAAEARAVGKAQCGPPLSGTSYWLDFWLFILFDVLLFIFFYLLP